MACTLCCCGLSEREREGKEKRKKKPRLKTKHQELAPPSTKRSVPDIFLDRELECTSAKRMTNRRDIMCNLIPKSGQMVSVLRDQMFSGKYSPNGDIFAASAQDQRIRFFDTHTWKQTKVIQARDVSWAVLDTDYSNDQRFLCYCSWSDKVRIVNTTGDVETHAELAINPPTDARFCLFSVKFSPDSLEILGGSCDRAVYIYDLVKDVRTVRIQSHADDINAVCYSKDGSGNIFFSGSDDCMLRVYDKREESCVGSFHGHVAGVTSIDTQGEHYLISNSKDQSIKLWDMRKMGDKNERAINFANVDYRLGRHMQSLVNRQQHPNDISLVQFRGHTVLQTLIRAYFSPKSTGGRYIYAGSFDGAVRIWDILTGDIIETLKGHEACVRDCSWNPAFPEIASVSWDGSIRVFSPSNSKVIGPPKYNNHEDDHHDNNIFEDSDISSHESD